MKANVLASHLGSVCNNTSFMCRNLFIWENRVDPGSRHPGGLQTHQRRRLEMSRRRVAGGCHWHPTWVQSQPRRVTTTRIRWPPSEVHCATHERQPVCNPMPKTQTRNPKTATQGLPEWWRSPNWVDMATVTHVNRVATNIHQPAPKLQSQRQLDCRWQSQWQCTAALPSPQRRVGLDNIPSSDTKTTKIDSSKLRTCIKCRFVLLITPCPLGRGSLEQYHLLYKATNIIIQLNMIDMTYSLNLVVDV